VQHEFYHQYTADEHTLMCLEQLDRVWEAKQPPHNTYAQLFQQIERPFVLYLALLLHDVGKSDHHGRHEEASGKYAMRVARRLHLDATAAHSLRLIIENHLLMTSVSQRRDLDDPAVIRQFAKQIQSAENVSLLTLHSFADSMATSDKLWNGFKDTLLWSLFHKAMSLMSGGTEFARAEEKHRDLLRDEVRRSLPKEIEPEELDAHFAGMPARYFVIHTPREILEDIQLAHRFMRLQVAEGDVALAPVIRWLDDVDRGCNVVKVCTWDRAGLFSKIAGCFSACGLSILSAQVFSRVDGVAEDTFFVIDARSGNLADKDQREKFEAALRKALSGAELDLHALIGRHKITRPAYQAYAGERIPTRVHFDNEASETRSLIEIETEDRVGLLYAITETLSELELDISGAKILTEKGAAIDSFYVREEDGSKVSDSVRQAAIEKKLLAALNKL
jgi:[protein-PII] uridylyltransferase